MKIDVKSMRYGAFILTFANIFSQLLGFVYRMLLSRAIGAEGMGLFQLIFPFYSLSMSIATSGICVAVSRLSSEYMALGNYRAIKALIKRAIFVFFCIFSVLSAFSALFASGIAEKFLGDSRTRLAVYALIPVIFFTGIENIHKNFFYGTKTVNPPALSDFLEQIIRMSAVLFLLKFLAPQSDELMLVVIVCGMLICEIFSSLFLRAVYLWKSSSFSESGVSDKHMSRKIIKIAIPISLASLFNNLLSSLIVIIIPRRLALSGLTASQALSEFGVLFGMTMPLLNLPSALIVGLGLVMVPKLSENLALGNYSDLKNKISRSITATSFVILPSLAVMVPLGGPLGEAIFNQGASREYILPLAIGTAFSIYMMILGSILNGLGKQNISAFNFLLGNAIELAITYFLAAIPELRLYGYIIAFILSTALTMLLNFIQVIKTCKIRPNWSRWFVNPLLASILAAFTASAVFSYAETLFGSGFSLFAAIIASILVYFGISAFQGK